MLGTVRLILVAVVTTVILGGLATLLRRARPAALEQGSGTIRPERWTAWLTVLGGAVMLGAAAWASIYENGGWPAAGIAVFGALIVGFMAPSLTAIHAVHWNEQGIEGPSKTFGLTLGTARTEIAWPDIVKTGKTTTGYWFVESADGRRIYWSYLYKGYGSLIAALKSHRPSLDLRFG